jgi:hypothetical protein
MSDIRCDEETVNYNNFLKEGPSVILHNALLLVEDLPGETGKYFGMREIMMALIVVCVAKDTGRKK